LILCLKPAVIFHTDGIYLFRGKQYGADDRPAVSQNN
jgi:hypothetical protein